MFYKEWFAQSDLLMWPIVGLVIFFTVFLAVVVRVLRKGARGGGSLDRIASLPLADEETPMDGDYPKGAA
jgi:cbb3-type cytochrome oxidase subunit 3